MRILYNDFDSDPDENLKAFSLIGDLVKIENSLKGIACWKQIIEEPIKDTTTAWNLKYVELRAVWGSENPEGWNNLPTTCLR